MSTTLISCGSDKAALQDAARKQAQAQARVNLNLLPVDCHTREPHAAFGVGSDKLVVLIQEGRALDRANDRVQRCADLSDNQVKALR